MEVKDNSIPCDFASLFSRNIHHVLEHIFLSLDTASLRCCLDVCQAWRTFLSSDSFKKKMSRTHLQMWMDADNLKHQGRDSIQS